MTARSCLAWLFSLSLMLGMADADTLNYQGRIVVDGTPFNGAGQFRFAIVGGDGTVLWSTSNLDLLVRNGVYTARLGDEAAGMPHLPEGLMSKAPQLRVWFNDKGRGWQQAGGDVPLAGAAPVAAEGGSISSTQAAAILAELREVRALLAKQQTPPPPQPKTASMPLRDAPSLGQANAPLVLVEIIDFQAGLCRRFNAEVFPALMSNYIDTGKVRLVSRNLPLHPQSEPAARAARCAQKQGKYWEIRERLFALGSDLNADSIARAAKEVGLDLKAFAACFDGSEARAAAQTEASDAQAAGIADTPSFVLGKQDGDKVTGIVIAGEVSLDTFEKEIYQRLIRPTGAVAP